MEYQDIMAPYRRKIDELDDKIVDLLAQREEIIREVADLKTQKLIPAILPDRVAQVKTRVAERACKSGLDADLVRQIYAILIDYSCSLEEEIMQKRRNKETQKKAVRT